MDDEKEMRLAIVLSLLLGCSGCGITDPSDDLIGDWVARSIGHSDFVGMTLRQSGDAITGTACASSSGVVLYKNVPVTGDYPNMQFTVAAGHTEPCCAQLAGRVFKGKQDSTLDIVGSYGTFDLRFERSSSSLCP